MPAQFTNPPQVPKKGQSREFKIVILAAALISIIAASAVMASLLSTPQSTTSPTPPTTDNTPGWHSVARFTGSGGLGIPTWKDTSSFRIRGTEFRYNWDYTASYPDAALFWVFLSPEGEDSISDYLAKSGSSKSGIEYVYIGPGVFYMNVTTANVDEWSIAVDDFY